MASSSRTFYSQQKYVNSAMPKVSGVKRSEAQLRTTPDQIEIIAQTTQHIVETTPRIGEKRSKPQAKQSLIVRNEKEHQFTRTPCSHRIDRRCMSDAPLSFNPSLSASVMSVSAESLAVRSACPCAQPRNMLSTERLLDRLSQHVRVCACVCVCVCVCVCDTAIVACPLTGLQQNYGILGSTSGGRCHGFKVKYAAWL